MHSLLSDVGQWLVFLGPHLRIHILVELGCHFYKKKTLKKKKKKKEVYTRELIMTSLILTLFSFDVDAAQDVGRRVRTKVIKGKGLRIY